MDQPCPWMEPLPCHLPQAVPVCRQQSGSNSVTAASAYGGSETGAASRVAPAASREAASGGSRRPGTPARTVE